MKQSSDSPTRRSLLGAGSLLLAPSLQGAAKSRLMSRLPEKPTRVLIDLDGSGLKSSVSAATVDVLPNEAGQEIRVLCPSGPLNRVVLRWEVGFPENTLFLGDQWERSYGDLQWRFRQPERVMPWYFAAHHAPTGETFMAGVKTGPSALCFWMVDEAGVSLWLDFRNGGSPSLPGNREIAAASVVSFRADHGEPPASPLRRFCTALCPKPRLAGAPLCGNNNWYYAYGRGFDAGAMLRDAAFLAEVSPGQKNRPYCVIDAGWTPDYNSVCPGGPWTTGDPQRFPDVPGLAQTMKRMEVRPGIWVRPTALSKVDDPRRLRSGPSHDPEKPLDLTLSENLELIHDDVARIRSWGYELIKHDFSTYDVFGRWGFQMGAELTDGGWHFNDRSLTNAEIILRLYRTLRTAAGNAVLLGCNTIGHLGAGLFELQRTGDDTSGREWERTRRMGVNTLAYRMPQHGTFFAIDPDCAAHTELTPWELDSQFLDLVSRSGAALFISVDPRTVTPEQKAAFRNAMQRALAGVPIPGEPLDWLHTTTPESWSFGGAKVKYSWTGSAGANPLRV